MIMDEISSIKAHTRAEVAAMSEGAGTISLSYLSP
jgi:hypothetical protein